MKYIRIILLIIFVCLFASLCNSQKTDNNSKVPKTESNGVYVDIDIVKQGNLYEYIEISAIMEACQKGEVYSQVSAPVIKVNIYNGKKVKSGDTLLVLDPRNIKNTLIRYRSDYIKALSELVLELETSGKPEVIDAWQKYQLQVAEDDFNIPHYPEPQTAKMTVMLSRLNIQVNYNMVKEFELQFINCIVRSPFTGTISDVNVYPGILLSTGTKICDLTDLSRMQVQVEILEEDIKTIESGTRIHLLNDSNQLTEIAAVLPKIDESKHTGIAIAYIDNPNQEYKDGQSIQVKVEKNIYNDRLYIPRSALLNRNDRDLVFVVKKGIAKWCYVDVGFGNDEFLEITKGIEIGDTVIVGGHYSLAHNVSVNIR